MGVLRQIPPSDNGVPICSRAMERLGKNVDTVDVFKAGIEAAGFTNVHEKVYKVSIGDWAKDSLMKEVGRYHKSQIMEGLEGYIMYGGAFRTSTRVEG